MAASIVAASTVSSVVQWIVNRLPIERESNVPQALTWSLVFVLSCGMLVVLWRRWTWASTLAAWILPAALTSTVQALRLFGTPFYLFGTHGDQFFRMQYLQRLTVSSSLADDNYAGLPPFYPAGWFWLGGRFANLIGHPAWSAYKPFAILTIAVVSSLSFVLWSLVVSRRRALGAAGALALAGTVLGSYEPYAWIAIVLVPPLAVLSWRLFRSMTDRRAAIGVGPATVVIGTGIGVTAATYTLVFGFAVLLVVAMATTAVLVGRRDGTFASDRATVRDLARAVAVRLALIGIAAVPITLWMWGPYLHAAIRLPSAGNAAAQFLSRSMATLGTPMLRPTLTGVICMIGLVWIVLSWRHSSVAQAFGITLLACVLWQLMSTVALAADTTLLSGRVARVGTVVLWCACAFAMIDLAAVVPRRFTAISRRSTTVLVSVLAVLVTVELAQTPSHNTQHLVDGAFTSYDADGHAVNPGNGRPSGRFNKRLIDAIARMSGRQPQDNILLTNNYQLLVFQPYYGFQMNKEQYANPLARYPERNQELVRWSRSATAAEFLAALTSSEFETPNVFVLRRDGDGDYRFSTAITDFPRNNKAETITFPARLFESAHFSSREVGPFTVIVRD